MSELKVDQIGFNPVFRYMMLLGKGMMKKAFEDGLF